MRKEKSKAENKNGLKYVRETPYGDSGRKKWRRIHKTIKRKIRRAGRGRKSGGAETAKQRKQKWKWEILTKRDSKKKEEDRKR